MIATAALAAGLLGQSVFPTPVAAQAACDRRDKVIALLAEKYDEAPVAAGVTTDGSLIEVLTTGEGKTWTIIMTSPEGVSCLLVTGEGWKPLQQLAREPEA